MTLLRHYVNGNTEVHLYDDGTKVREYKGKPILVHPESFDCKITNYCNNNCKWCHEKSSSNGKHANLSRLLEVIKPLPAGVEIAIGGGNILTHPNLIPFLEEVKERGLIANTTINQKSIQSNTDLIVSLIQRKLIFGLGISVSSSSDMKYLSPLLKITDNIVFHIISGVSEIKVIEELMNFALGGGKTYCKVLILGYKEYGLGTGHYLSNKDLIDKNKLKWYREIGVFFKKDSLVLSFDNLAISQLNIRRFFSDKMWKRFYMGEEGFASMYIDAVEQKYAICSVDSNRVSFDECGLIEFFKSINK